ncbi:MAG TPA: hypothetical protein VGQ76_09660 [Thermoanaerobaculia bacterium]|jgi:uncharacterized repeat protein (TIGR01451 family)|nr:hypothetical protein [Thermoanaerobaculia bacterium]
MRIAVLISFILILFAAPAAIAADSSGTDFWVAFPRNVPPEQAIYLLITAATPTSGVVSNASFAINVPFNVVPGTPTKVTLPYDALDLDVIDTVENKGVHVTSLAPITLHGSLYRSQSADAFMALPVDAIGTDYVLMSWGPGLGVGSELVVVATENDTTVTITPTINAASRTAGVPFQLVLQQGQTYFLAPAGGDGDLTGSTIVSDKPISVFGGHSCGEVPTADTDFCDSLIEQMFPTSAWGQTFMTMPLATRTGGEIVRVLASQSGTEVTYNGSVVAILNAGQFYQTSATQPAHITTTQPALVAQYAKGTTVDDVTGDPFQMLILPTSQFASSYIVPTGPGDIAGNFLNLIVPTAAVDSVEVDGVAVPPASFTPIETSGYSGAQLPVSLGEHRIIASAPLGAWMYGFDNSEGYGYPAGALLAPLGANLSIVKTAGSPEVVSGGAVSYTIVVSNSGPETVIGATVTDDFDAALTNVSWTCSASPGASCSANGVGDLEDLVTLPAGGNVTYTITATAPVAPTAISNTATVTPPDNTNDPTPADNSSSAEVIVSAAPLPEPIPTASEWALMLFAMVLGGMGMVALRKGD